MAALALCACLPAAERTTDRPDVTTVEVGQLNLVRVRARDPRTTGAPVARVVVDAHFAAFSGVDRRHVMSALDLWIPDAPSGCVAIEDLERPAVREVDIELASAGTLGLSGAGARLTAEPRAVPAFLPELSGYVYGEPESAVPFVPRANYLVWAEGDRVDSFAVPVTAPEPVRIAEVSGHDPGSADAIDIGTRASLDLVLDTEAREVFVTVREAGDLGVRAIQCRIEADQGVEFDAAWIDATFSPGAPVEVVARTVSVAALPESVGPDAQILVEYFDRVVVRR
jgi:hypothetical protein